MIAAAPPPLEVMTGASLSFTVTVNEHVAVLLLASAVSLFYVLASVAWVALSRRVPPHFQPLSSSSLFAAVWTLAELMRGQWFTGFPWGAGGYAHVEGPLAALALLTA